LYFDGKLTLEKIVEKTSHRVAQLFQIEKRGFIRKGYFADLVLIDPESPWEVTRKNILYKCRWSPFDGHTFKAKVKHTFVNGNHVFKDGKIDETHKGMRLMFGR
jgi:dihydroorotase